MTWHYKYFEELSLSELYAILKLRNEVFIVEQNCPYIDVDGKDSEALHLFSCNGKGEVLAYCRLLPNGISYPEYSIGRVVTSASMRGQGTGRQLMLHAIDYITNAWGGRTIKISAQNYLRIFYEALGFRPVGEVYLEDNIPHIEMRYEAPSA